MTNGLEQGSTVVCGYLVVVDGPGLGWNTVICGYPAVVVDRPGLKWNTVVRGYPAMNNGLGQGRTTAVCGYQVVNDEPLRRWNTVVCGYPAVVVDGPGLRWNTVISGYRPVNHKLGQGRTTVVCCYQVVGGQLCQGWSVSLFLHFGQVQPQGGFVLMTCTCCQAFRMYT